MVFIAGNHDFIKHDSYYLTFRWNENVYPLLNGHMGSVEFKELKTSVYGLAIIRERLRRGFMIGQRRQDAEI